MRNVLGRACPWEGCEEEVIEAQREVHNAGGFESLPVVVARCPAGHDSLVTYEEAETTRLTPAPWASHVVPEVPPRPTTAVLVTAAVAGVLFVGGLLFWAAQEDPPPPAPISHQR